MYNYDFLCSYHLISDEKLSNLCYQHQYLQAFNLDKYKYDVIESTCNLLYDELKEISSFKELINKIRKKLDSSAQVFFNIHSDNSDDTYIFFFFFSYEYFYLFHKEYCYYKQNRNFDFNNVLENL